MSPNLQRCMKQAPEYPNTATVDILIAAVEKESEQAANEIYRLRQEINQRRETREQTCPKSPPS